MTQKFQVGDRVQVIRDNKVEIDTIMTKRYNTYQLDKEPRDCWIEGWQLAPAPALVVVPRNVANTISPILKNSSREIALERLLACYFHEVNENYDEDFEEGSMNRWIGDNFEKFISAVLDGYTVEKEPLYMVEFPSLAYPTYLVKSDDGILAWQNTDQGTKLTEQEIKAIDERYWQFAVPVEEGGADD